MAKRISRVFSVTQALANSVCPDEMPFCGISSGSSLFAKVDSLGVSSIQRVYISKISYVIKLKNNRIASKACLTQTTRLIRLAIRVNRTYNRTNRGLIRVTLRQFECIRESRV